MCRFIRMWVLWVLFFFFKFVFTHLYCLVGCLSMIVWTHVVLGVFNACVLYFCICTCSAQLSMFHMKRCSKNALFIVIKVPGNRGFHTLDVVKAFSFSGLCPLTPTRDVAHGPHQGQQKAPGPPLSDYLSFLHSHL